MRYGCPREQKVWRKIKAVRERTEMVFTDLVNDNDITDIKMLSFDDISVKYRDGVIKKGLTLDDFSSKEDYDSFVGDMLREKKGVSLKDAFVEHFYDDSYDNCTLKVSVSSERATLRGIYVMMRKLPKIR